MKELRDALLMEVGERLRPLGFRARVSYRDFYRELGSCRQLLHISFINHKRDFDVTADVAVRHHVVEDVRNQGRPYLAEAEKKQTATIGAELGNIAGRGQHRWAIIDRNDIPSAADGIVSYFRGVGLPFLERFSSLRETFEVLRGGSKESRLICPFDDERAKIVKIIGGLLPGDAS